MPDLALTDLTNQAIRVSGFTYTRPLPEAASQTFNPGELLTIDSAGRVSLFAAAGSSLDSTGNRLVGMAQEAASGTTDNEVNVTVFTERTVLALPVYHSTAASAVTADTNVDSQCVLINETTGGAMANIAVTTNPILHIIGIAESYDGTKHATGDKYAPLLCKIIGSSRFDQD